MFFNAMRRKGWVPREDDMPRRVCVHPLARGAHADSRLAAYSVVAIHNTVNERAWREVLAWESLHSRCEHSAAPAILQSKLRPHRALCSTSECASIRLLRFCGKPQDYSPKARLMNLLGYKLPFDRHDWVIDRCGKEARAGALHCAAWRRLGTHRGVLPFHQVRYVIDFYNAAPEPGKPIGMHLDVRPALDSPQAAVDRIRMQLRWIGILAQQQQQQQQAAPPDAKPAV